MESNKYKDSKLQEIDMDVKKSNKKKLTFAPCTGDGEFLMNYDYVSTDVAKKVFFLDKTDLDWLKSSEGSNQFRKEYGECLTEFMTIRPEKRIYLRYFSLTQNQIETRRVLPEEVLEIIPLVLKQQKTPTNDDDECLQNLRQKWIECKESDLICGNTIDTEELENALEEFDVNKELITLINDPFYAAYAQFQLNKGTKPLFLRYTPQEQVMFPSQALLCLFEYLVCNINWKKLLTRPDSHMVEIYRVEICKYMLAYDAIDSSCLVRHSDLETIYKDLHILGKCFDITQEPYRSDAFEGNSNMTAGSFRRELDHFNLRDFTGFPKKPVFEVTIARVCIRLGWMDAFFDKNMMSLKKKIMDAMVYKVKEKDRDLIFKLWEDVSPLKAENKRTIFREYPVSIETVLKSPRGVYTCGYNEVGRLAPNAAFFEHREKEKIKFFICDKEDIRSVNSFEGSWETIGDRLDSLTMYLTHEPQKRIYIRTVSMISNEKEVRRLIAEEVLEIIPLVLKQQNCPIFSTDDRLGKYWNLWKPVAYRHFRLSKTIDMEEFIKVLEEFDINKDLITVVPDLSHEITSRKLLEDGCTPITFISYDCQPVMFTGQALLHIFHSAICGVNWKIKRDIGEYDQMLRSLISNYSEMDQNLLILKRSVVEDITKLLTQRPPELKPLPSEGVSDYKISNFGGETQISSIDYCRTCDIYGLDYLIDVTGKNNLPLLMARQNYYMGFVKNFFKSEDGEIKKRLRDEFLWKTDKSLRTSFYQYLTKKFEIDNLNLGRPGANLNEKEVASHMDSEIITTPEEDALKMPEERKKLLDEFRNDPNVQIKPTLHLRDSVQHEQMKNAIRRRFYKLDGRFEATGGDVLYVGENFEVIYTRAAEPELENESVENRPKKKKKKSKKTGKESCLNNESLNGPTPEEETPDSSSGSSSSQSSPQIAQILDATDYKKKFETANFHNIEAQRLMKIAVKKANEFEQKAKRTDVLEKKLKEMRKEMELLEKKIGDQQKHSQENERLRTRIAGREDIEKKLRAERNEYQQKTESLLEENTRLIKQSDEDKNTVVEMKKKLEAAKGKTREVNKEWCTRNEELNKEITRLNGEIKKKDDEIAAINQSNKILITTNTGFLKINKDRNNEIEILKSRLVVATRQSTPTSSLFGSSLLQDSPSTSTSCTPSLPEDSKIDPMEKLEELQRMKNRFFDEKTMGEAKEIVKKLNSVSDDKELLDLAQYELIRLELLVQIYQKTLAANLLILQRTNDISQLIPMQYPSMSPEFKRKYAELMISLTTGIPDTDCLICHNFRKADEKTIECETTCHKVYHWECASKWFKYQQICPHCRSRMLDDEEYPAL